MKLIHIVFLATILAVATPIPWKAQIALLNSLQVGRNQDPMAWTCSGCDNQTRPLTSTVIQNKGYQVKSIQSVYEQYTVLAFRYTANLKNVGQDILWAIQRQDENACKGCKVQRQFDRMWNKIRGDVLAGLKKSAHTGRLIITGISLGGALACLSFVDIVKAQIFQNIQIITFGAPRVGNRRWAGWFDLQTPSQRYFIKADPIAFLPRCLTLICNYKQTGTAIVCNKQKQECRVKKPKTTGEQEQENEMTTAEYFNALSEAVYDHYAEEDDNVDSIIDHIYGYKKIRNYTLIE